MAPSHRFVRLARGIYRLILGLAPRGFRRTYGSDAERDFAAILDDTLARRGAAPAAALTAAAVGDAARTGMREHAPLWRTALVSGLGADVRRAVRLFRREPLLAGAVTLATALALGPAMAASSVVFQTVLAPLPNAGADRVVVVYGKSPRGDRAPLQESWVADLRQGAPAFSAVGAVRPRYQRFVTTGGTVAPQTSSWVTGGFLTMLGARFSAGRDLAKGEPAAVVLSAMLARQRFGGDALAVGQTLLLDARPHVVVGVLAHDLVLPYTRADLYEPNLDADGPEPARNGTTSLVMARLASGVSITTAQAQADAAASRFADLYALDRRLQPNLIWFEDAVRGPTRPAVTTLFGAASALLAIALAGLASLCLVRGATRLTDVAVRTSLGASPWRVTRSATIDGLTLALPGVIGGGVIAIALSAMAMDSLPPGAVPLEYLGLDASPAIVGVAMWIAIAALFGAAPWMAGPSRIARVASVGAGRAVVGRARRVWQPALITAQVAITVTLLAAAVWLSASLNRLLNQPLGFEPDGVVVISTTPQPPRYADRPARIALAARVLEQLQRVAGPDAAITSATPGTGASTYGPLRIRPDQPLRDSDISIVRFAVSQDYFRVMQIPFVAGATFSSAHDAAPASAIIVSKSFAARWFAGGAMGQTVSFGRDDRRTIIGVVDDARSGTLLQEVVPQYYVPFTETSLGNPATYVIRSPRPMSATAADVSAAMLSVDPSLPYRVTSMDAAVGGPIAPQRLSAIVSAGLAITGLLLAVINVYALSAVTVVRRTREIGLRMALGAPARGAVSLVMSHGLRAIVAGLALGAAAIVWIAAPLLRAYLFDVRTTDPSLIVMAFLCTGATAVVATWLPARRAAHIDPAITLRSE